MKEQIGYDVIVMGSGMGGLSVASMLASDGYKVLILEAALHPGGCSSSYPRKGYIFESGATTLIGFDEHQPLRTLERKTGIHIPKEELDPSMSVWFEGQRVIRYKNKKQWIEEAIRVFGEPEAQRSFWELAYQVSDMVWSASERNKFFPPENVIEWFKLALKNPVKDALKLKYAFRSVSDVMHSCGCSNPKFEAFLDEQLMITAQASAAETPFLFGAAGITYTNYSNYYVPGGLINMINTIIDYIRSKNGEIHTKEKAVEIKKSKGGYVVSTSKNKSYHAPVVISNIPVWNMSGITDGEICSYFQKESDKYQKAWGAITMGIAMKDDFPEEMSLHNQIHLKEGETIPFTSSGSLFVSMSKRGDEKRAPIGERVLNISCHTDPEIWFNMKQDYDRNKEIVQEFLLEQLAQKLPGFSKENILLVDLATPVSWEKWVYRKKGRVGGIPQNMARSLLDWTSNETPFEGLYMVGDTTFPGQGIPGVTLSGINVYYRVVKNLKKQN